jgi:hypothetical protein
MAYGVVKKKRRLNPGRRRMTAKQIRFFGTKRQRAALKAGVTRRKRAVRKMFSNPRHKNRAARARKRSKRKQNVSSILVASIPGLNPGGRKRMKHRRRRNKAHRVHHRRRNRRSNPSVRYRTKTKIVYRKRARHHRRGRRRNPGMLGGGSGDVMAVAGIISGAALTRLLTGFVPAQYNTGVPGYIITGIAAVVQGQAVAKLLKKPAFGKYMTWGGLTYLGLRVVNDMIPSLSSYLPFGLQGMGLLSPTDGFPLPSVPLFGSMGNFRPPRFLAPAVMPAKASGLHGIGNMSSSSMRVGRIQ